MASVWSWGNIATGSKSTRQGRVGILLSYTETDTQLFVNIKTYFWSMYSVSDTNNSYYYNGNLIGSRSINHTVATGSGWSESNRTLLGEANYTYNKGTSSVSHTYTASLTGIDSVGSSNVMTATSYVNVAALASYTVSYNANGGSGAPSSQTKWYGKNLTLSSTKPTRAGYTFKGWGTSSSDTSVDYNPGGSYTANKTITLYAIWSAGTYTIYYHANGGTGAPASQTKTHGQVLTLSSTIPTRQNYNFLGWSKSMTATTQTYNAGGPYTDNAGATLYAVWQLAYTKPRISNVAITRCDANSNASDAGTYANVQFSWATDTTVTKITIQWKTSSTSDYTQSTSVTPNGTTSGYVNVCVGDAALAVDTSYDFVITVTDSDSSMAFGDVAGSVFAIDFIHGARGVAFGKKADINETVEFAWPIYPRGGFTYPYLEPGTDLNNVTACGVYYGNAASTHGYLNCPITTATSFTLEVLPAGTAGQIIQRITYCTEVPPVQIRCFYSNTWHDWQYTGM